MSAMPPSGSRSVPTRAKKSSSGMSGGLGAALRAGAENVSKPAKEPVSQKPKKGPQVRIAKSTYSNLIATKILKAAGLGFLLVVIIYMCFALTIVRVLPTMSAGVIPVKNITFPGGLIPAGEEVAVDMVNTHPGTLQDYFFQTITPSNTVSIVRVEAGPWDKFQWNQGVVTHDEEILKMTMNEAPSKTILENEYLVTCVSGACTPGQGYIIPATQVMGQPL